MTKSAKARGSDLRTHFKNMRETAMAIKKMNLQEAKKYLEEVIAMRRRIVFRRYCGASAAPRRRRTRALPTARAAGPEVRGDAPQHPEERRVQRGGTRGIEAAHGSDAGFFLEARGRSKRAGERPRRAPRGRSRGEEPLLSARPNDATAARVRASRRRRAAFAVGIATHHARVFDAFSVFRDCEGHSKNTLSPQKKFAKRDRLTLSSLPSSLASSPFTHDRSRVLTPRRSPCTTSR